MDFKYPYTDFHELNLDWFLAEFKKLTESWLQVQKDWEDEQQAFQDLHDYVENYFANLDLYQEVRDILWSPEMQGNIQIILSNLTTNMLPGVVADQITAVVASQLSTVVALQLPAVVANKLPSVLPAAVAGEASAWLADHVDPDTGYVIDDTLTISQAAADAAITGYNIDIINAYTGNHTVKYVKDKWLRTFGDPVDLTDIRTQVGWEYALIDCAEGDHFHINSAYIGTSAEQIVITDDAGNKLYVYNNFSPANEIDLIIPAGGTKLILNNDYTVLRWPVTYKGTVLSKDIKDVNDTLSNDIKDLDEISQVNSVFTKGMFEKYGIIPTTGEIGTGPRSHTSDYISKAITRIQTDDSTYDIQAFAYDENDVYIGQVTADGTGYTTAEGNPLYRSDLIIPKPLEYKHKIVIKSNIDLIDDAMEHITVHGYAEALKGYIDMKAYNKYAIPWKYYKADDDVTLAADFNALIALYDDLVTKYPEYVSKYTLTSNLFTNYEYVFTTGVYNRQAGMRNEDPFIAKPVLLLITGVHGYEKSSIMSTYAFLKALCNDIGPLAEIKDKLTIRVIPCVTPWSFDNNTRWNENGVNINRNFNADWIAQGNPFENDYSGPSPASEDETKIVQNWLDTYMPSAIGFIDHHNSGYDNEVSWIGLRNSLTGASDVKKQYRYAIDKLSNYWRYVRKMTSSSLIFEYTGESTTLGSANRYGANNYPGKPTTSLETSWNQNSSGLHSNYTIGTGSEALACLVYAFMKYSE